MTEDELLSWDSIGGEGPGSPAVETPKPEATPAPVPPPEAAIPPPEPPETAPAGNSPQEPAEPGIEVEPATPPPGKPKQHRLRPNDPTEELAFEMMRAAQKEGSKLSLKDALAKAEAITKPSEQPPEAPPNDPLQAVTTELEQVRKQLDDFAADESLYTPEVRKAQARESELLSRKSVIELQQAQAAEAQAQQSAQSFQEKEDLSWQETRKAFPDIDNAQSPLAQAFKAEWDTIAADPKHPLYSLADLPETLAAKHALKLGIQAKVGAPAATPPPAPTRPGLQPAPATPGSRTVTPGTLTEAQQAAQFTQTLAKASDSDIDAMLDSALWDKSAQPMGFRL